MTEDGRTGVLRRALEACFAGDLSTLPEVFTEDVSGWSPNMLVTSLDELSTVVADRDESLSDVSVRIDGLDVAGDKGFAEYRVRAVFSGPFRLDEETVLEPTNREILLGAALAADFTGDKISAFRNYFDDMTLLAQMLDE